MGLDDALPSHQGLNSITTFLPASWTVTSPPLAEQVVTESAYTPTTALGVELTDSFTVLPICSTILASHRSSSRSSTNGTMMWVPLDTMGRGPEREQATCYAFSITFLDSLFKCIFFIFSDFLLPNHGCEPPLMKNRREDDCDLVYF